MSQYISFFLGESKEKLLCKLCSFSRSSVIFQKFRGGPYEQVEKLTAARVDLFAHQCNEEKIELEHQLVKIDGKIGQIARFDNSAEEKFQLISELDSDKEEINDQLEEVKFSTNFAFFLSELVANAERHGKFHIYYGIEVPFL